MARKKAIPLEERLAETLALRGKLTLRGAMHSTGVKPPDPKGGVLLCSHGTPAAGDGRCLGCKREADQRLYRNRQYMKAMAALVDRGIARAAGKSLWVYAGPPVQPPARRKPALPAEPVPVMAADESGIFMMPSGAPVHPPVTITGMTSPDHVPGAEARRLAELGQRWTGHESCVFCSYYEAMSADEHDRRPNDWSNSPRDCVENGYREHGHEDCNICQRIEEQLEERDRFADEERREEARTREIRRGLWRAAMDRGERYAYQSDGRRIRENGTLCMCDTCDERVARHERRRVRPSRGSATLTADIDRLAERMTAATRVSREPIAWVIRGSNEEVTY